MCKESTEKVMNLDVAAMVLKTTLEARPRT